MARTIHVLTDAVANQIAAGEVVERPASVIKELVENALDARATTVEVAVERGGKRLIRVADDGLGMGREDALLSLDRHATSKITDATDLRHVASFGFRGEALPSIAAVSRMTLDTREAGDDLGTRLRVAGGRITAVEDLARRRGTTVEVRDLFYNAPARGKFLKNVATETRAVAEVVTSLALANPRVAFTLASDDRKLLDLPASGDVAGRIAELWGHEEAAALVACRGETGGLEVRGLVQRPDAARPGIRRAHLFVNGRPFRENALLKAVDRGYRTTVPPRVRPWAFLYLDVAAGSVDVNVHPSKAEVRFRDLPAVEALVEDAVRTALAGASSSATLDTELGASRGAVRDDAGTPYTPGPRNKRKVAPENGPEQMALFVAGRPPEGADPEAAGEGHEDAPAPDTSAVPIPPVEEAGARLWQVHRTWILAETPSGLLIVDQHSAHERILFEEMMTAFDDGGRAGQRLLFPLTLRLPPSEYAEVETLQGLLARAGFEVEGFGGDTILVQAVPDPHPWFDAERCLREMIAELTAGSPLVRSARNQHERIAMTFACKGAIKAGQRLDAREMEELVEGLFATELPYHDVHGRPTIVRLSTAELERKFGRSGR